MHGPGIDPDRIAYLGRSIGTGVLAQVAKDTPNTNLFLAMLDKLGVPLDTLGDSNGRVETLSV